jgi:CBS domain-containing protein
VKLLSHLIHRELISVRPGESIARAVELMNEKRVGSVVVIEQLRPVGILTDRDVAMALGLGNATPDDPVQTTMTCPVTTMREDEGIFDATQYMMENALRRVPIVDKYGRAVGVVSLDDLLILLTRELNNLAKGVRVELSTAF